MRDGDFLVPIIDGRDCAAGNADDLLVSLRAKRKTRERHRNGNALLQNKIRTEQEEKNEEEGHVHPRQKNEPTEVIFLRTAKLHEALQC